MRRSLLVASILFGAFAAGCKSSGGSSLPETICTPGQATCFGNYVGVCRESGKGFDLTFCGAIRYCQNGQCLTRVCTPTTAQCIDDKTTEVCDELGATTTQKSCSAGEACFQGQCLPLPCDAGTTYCIYDTLLTCTGGGYDQEPCGEGKACKDGQCVDERCKPEEATCIEAYGKQVSLVCNHNGTDFQQTVCKSSEECVSGFCFQKVAHPEPPPMAEDVIEDAPEELVESEDVGPHDVRDIEEAPKVDAVVPGLNQAKINGTLVKFVMLHDANFVPDDQMLMINLISKKIDGVPFPDVENAKHNIEIRIQGVEPGQVGVFNCGGAGSYVTELWYRYGKYPQGETCKNFDYAAVDCTVTIEKFETPNGHVTGTFEAPVLQDCQNDGTTVQITEGVFDVIFD